MDISKTVKKFGFLMKKHSPEILTGIGIAGMISTTVMAVRVTPKALTLIKEKKKELKTDKLEKTEIIKATYKCYILPTATGVLSVICLIEANSVNLKRNAALTAACTLSETALREYKSKVVETIGEKKEKMVQDAVSKDIVEKNPVKEVIITEKGNTLCLEPISGRYFRSDIDKIKRAENELNRRLFDEMYVSINDLYFEIGLNSTSMGDDIGWNVNDGLLDLYFSSQLTEDNIPCAVINYNVMPKYGYSETF